MPTSSTLYLNGDTSTHTHDTQLWTNTGAGTFYYDKQGIAGASDTTYWGMNAIANNPSAQCCTLENSPSDAILITAIHVSFRGYWAGIAAGYAVQFDYWDGPVGPGVLIGQVFFDVPIDVTGTPGVAANSVVKDLTGLTLTKAQFDAIEVDVSGSIDGLATGDRIRIFEIWHTIDYTVGGQSFTRTKIGVRPLDVGL